MSTGDGIRLLISYHPIDESTDRIIADRYISGYDLLSFGDQSIRVIEPDVVELKKALIRLGADVIFPENPVFACSEDLYWNIPTISHGESDNLEKNVSLTLEALKLITGSFVNKGADKVFSFTLGWNRYDGKQVKVSVLGHCTDVLAWFKENSTIPIDKDKFRDWLEKQGKWLERFPPKEDRPALFEMVCSDGVLFIRRRGIDPEIKYELAQEGNNLMIKFSFVRDQYQLAEAYAKREIDVALGYILNETKCSVCGNTYRSCPHSKYLDENVQEIIANAQRALITWTDRKA